MFIKVVNQFVDYHYWEDAPEKVSFLRNIHRHVFHVITKIAVTTNDREIEYFLLQEEIEKYIEEVVIPMDSRKSCELMALSILSYLKLQYPGRKIEVEVNEDGENGSIATNF